jgi:alkanesulfonate monooxygenase SsuD/methylene tetrahydromethanopterin reductase-like flavin-dependent oxidoreductase (luciferase family)
MDYGRPVRFGVFVTPLATEEPLRLGVLADELGFDLLGIQDHPYQRRFFDTWTLLTAIAMRTERISLFPDVANLPLRPPAMLAKAAASLDILSGGRLELGLGAGGFWDAIVAYGGPRRTPAESVSAVEEAIQVIRLLWSGQHGIRYEGKIYELKGAHSGPLPRPRDRHLARRLQAAHALVDRPPGRRLGAVARLRAARGPPPGQRADR